MYKKPAKTGIIYENINVVQSSEHVSDYDGELPEEQITSRGYLPRTTTTIFVVLLRV